MTKEGKKNKKGLIIGISCGAVALVVAIVLIVLFVVNPGGIMGGLNDSYFETGNGKYVLEMGKDSSLFEDEQYLPSKVYAVYYVADGSVTGFSRFYAYQDDASAKAAYEHIDADTKSEAKEVKLRGKYIEIAMPEKSYEGISEDEVKQSIEFINKLKEMGDWNDDEGDYEDEEDEGDELIYFDDSEDEDYYAEEDDYAEDEDEEDFEE